ncbi:MAG: hypothetical protein ACKO8Z_04830, partial [Prosthecobacter sp.]
MLPPALINTLQQIPAPVILLEGTRRVPEAQRPLLSRFARQLAETLPHAIFRSGNAEGSDDAFAQGVAAVDAHRLQLVLPTPGMGRQRRPAGAVCHALNELPQCEKKPLTQACSAAYPENHRLFNLYLSGVSGTPAYSKALYLVRDGLKVIGSPGLGLAPASLAIFFVD